VGEKSTLRGCQWVTCGRGKGKVVSKSTSKRGPIRKKAEGAGGRAGKKVKGGRDVRQKKEGGGVVQKVSMPKTRKALRQQKAKKVGVVNGGPGKKWATLLGEKTSTQKKP